MPIPPVNRYPLLYFSAALLLGILCAPALGGPPWAYLALAAAAALIALVARRFGRSGLAWVALLLLTTCLGAARWASAHSALTPSDAGWWAGQGEIRLTGMVDAMPEPDGARLRFLLRVERLAPPGTSPAAGDPQPARGLVQVSVPRGTILAYGDRVSVRGSLSAMERAGAGQSLYLSAWSEPRIERRGQGSRLRAALFALRARAYQTVNAIFPQPEAALINGILLGLDGDLPEALAEAYRVTGTAHIIAISGFNIAVLAQACAGLFRARLRRWRALLATLLVVSVYALLAGGDPPVLRAALMGALVLLGEALGRRSSGLTSLGFTAALLCLFNPNLPWDISFQLTFAATLGLVLYAGPLQSAFARFLRARLPAAWAARLAAPLGEYVLVTLAAQVTTLPLMLLHFGRLATWSLLTNLLVLPPQPLVMMLSGAAALAGLLWLPLGRIAAWLAWPLAAYSNRMVELLARLPGGSLDVSVTAPALLALFYALLFAATWAARAGKLKRLWKPAAALTAAGLLASSAWSAALAAPDGHLHLRLLPAQNAGSAPAVLLTTPGGRALLLGGAGFDRLAERVQPLLPTTQQLLDGVIYTGSDPRGMAALPGFIERLAVGWLAAPDELWATPAGESTEKDLLDAGLNTAGLPAGASFDLGDGARLDVLPGGGVWVIWGRFCALLPGEPSPPATAALRGRGLDGCLLLGSGDEGMSALRPLWAWDAAQESGIHIETDGKQMWMERMP